MESDENSGVAIAPYGEPRIRAPGGGGQSEEGADRAGTGWEEDRAGTVRWATYAHGSARDRGDGQPAGLPAG